MSPEKEKLITEKYPKIFSSRNPENLFFVYCFEHGDGWFNIIDTLCWAIQNHVDNLRYNLKEITDEEFSEKHQVVAEQVKEKFASLRFYINNHDDYVRGLICMAEGISARTCESCGDPGERRGRGYIQTLCDSCHKPKDNKLVKD